MRGAFLFTWLAIICSAFARTLFNQTGLDGKSSHVTSSIMRTCLSASFNNTVENIYASNITDYYKTWTQKTLPTYLAQGSQNELDAVGTYLFGVSNYECSFVTGDCTDTSCQDIASFMNLDPRKELTDEQVEELKRRYFLSIILKSEIQMAYLIWEAVDLVRADLLERADELALLFAVQPDKTAIDKCAFDKAVITASIGTIASVISFASVFFTGGAAVAAFPAMIPVAGSLLWGSSSAPTVAAFISSVVTNTGFVTSGYVSSLGMFEGPGVPNTYSDWKNIETNIDSSRCAKSMGQFTDQNDLVQNGIKNNVVSSIERIRESITTVNKKKFHETSFNTTGGPSALASELGATSLWTLSLQFGDGLRARFRDDFKKQMTKGLTSLVLRSKQCSIKCLQLDPKLGVSDLQGIRLDMPHPLYVQQATFYPERVIAGENSSFIKTTRKEKVLPEKVGDNTKIEVDTYKLAGESDGIEPSKISKPTLQCQFQCLRQNDDAIPYFPVDTLNNFEAWEELKTKTHELLTEAVVTHIQGSGGANDYSPAIRAIIPGFSLPVCISSNLYLEDGSMNNPYESRPSNIYRPYDQPFFPLLCGDFRASETERFIREMPIGPEDGELVPDGDKGNKSIKMDTLRHFWRHSFVRSMWKLESRPFTHFMTLCAVGRAINFMPPVELDARPEENCDAVKDLTKDMSELEATLFFCNGMNERLNEMWIFESNHRSSWFLCGQLSYREAPLGIPKSRYWAIERQYIAQRKEWRAGSKNITDLEPFKWAPIVTYAKFRDKTSRKQLTSSEILVKLNAGEEMDIFNIENFVGANATDGKSLLSVEDKNPQWWYAFGLFARKGDLWEVISEITEEEQKRSDVFPPRLQGLHDSITTTTQTSSRRAISTRVVSENPSTSTSVVESTSLESATAAASPMSISSTSVAPEPTSLDSVTTSTSPVMTISTIFVPEPTSSESAIIYPIQISLRPELDAEAPQLKSQISMNALW